MSDVGIPVTDEEAAELPATEPEATIETVEMPVVEGDDEQFIAVTGHAPLYVPKGVTFADILARLDNLEAASKPLAGVNDAKPAAKKKA